MFALVKNLMTSRIRKIDCSELYNINRAACTYQLFKPTSTEDFVQKKCYGSIVNDKLVFNYILALSESEEQIMEWLDQPRLHKIPNPKRISDSPAFLSLVKCKLAEEKESCRAQKDSNHPKEVKKKFEQKILKKFKNINANTNKSELLKVPDLKVENKTSPVIASKRMQEERTEPQNKKKFKSFEGVCVCSSIKEEVELLKSENLDLKGKLTFATDSIESLESERRRLLEECEKLKVELQSTLNSHGSHIHEEKVALQEEISQLKTVVSDFRAAQENLHKKEGCALSKLQSAEDSDDNDNVSVDNSKIRCGNGISISKQSICDVEMKSEHFSNRVKMLAELFWPNKVHEMYMNANLASTKGNPVVVIPEANITAMTSAVE